MGKVSEAQKRANAKWDKENPEKRKRIRLKSACKSYIYNYVNTGDDLSEVMAWIDEKKDEIDL